MLEIPVFTELRSRDHRTGCEMAHPLMPGTVVKLRGNLSVPEAAQVMGIAAATWRNWESGRYKVFKNTFENFRADALLKYRHYKATK